MRIIKYITATILIFLIFGCEKEEEKIIRPVETIIAHKTSKLSTKNFPGIVISDTSPDLTFKIDVTTFGVVATART